MAMEEGAPLIVGAFALAGVQLNQCAGVCSKILAVIVDRDDGSSRYLVRSRAWCIR